MAPAAGSRVSAAIRCRRLTPSNGIDFASTSASRPKLLELAAKRGLVLLAPRAGDGLHPEREPLLAHGRQTRGPARSCGCHACAARRFEPLAGMWVDLANGRPACAVACSRSP